MNPINLDRRDFLKRTALLSAAALLSAGQATNAVALAGADAADGAARKYKISLNAYCFNKQMNDTAKGLRKDGGVTLMSLLNFCAKYKFDAIDPTGYFFPGYPKVPSDQYVKDFKQKAADLGIEISGTGVRNQFTTADKAVRAAAVEHIKEWVEVAAKLGAPVVRVFADTQMKSMTWHDVAAGATREQVQAWIAADLHECAEAGKKAGVRIGVQNHGDFLQTGEQLLALVDAAGSEWCGPIVDTGYFKTPDPYVDIELVAPRAVNWQIKQHAFGEANPAPIDLLRLMRIVRKSGYSGYLPIETLPGKDKNYDPFAVVPPFLEQVRDAIKQTA